MMRVISGKYKGKNLEGFGIVGTRPTMDRVKESLFGTLQRKVPNSQVLDLFAGSGSLGIEALSNGATTCYFVDNGKEISKCLKKNVEGVTGSILLFMDYQEALKKLEREQVKFDMVFLDPPYHLNLLNKALQELSHTSILKKDAYIVCEYEEEKPIVDEKSFYLIKEKKYGDKMITIYQYRLD